MSFAIDKRLGAARRSNNHVRGAHFDQAITKTNRFPATSPRQIKRPVSAELPFPDGLDLQDNAAFQRVWESQFLLRATPTLGLPAMTVSTGLVGQTPVGVQIVAGRYREDLCLRAGEAIEARGTPPASIDPRN